MKEDITNLQKNNPEEDKILEEIEKSSEGIFLCSHTSWIWKQGHVT